MWAAQKEFLSFAQIIVAGNVQYAGFVAVLSFCDYIIAQHMYQKAAISGLVLFESISQSFGNLLTQTLRRQHLNRIRKLNCPVQH